MRQRFSRRLGLNFLALSLLIGLGVSACDNHGNEQADPETLPEMTVYKTPDCGCCSLWVDHVADAGFDVTANDVSHQELNQLKEEAGLPFSLGSCHTAFVGDYVIEGHIPAEDIKRLLEEQPDILGIAVPGMPIGSPGMEMGERQDPYEVVSFDKSGETAVFSRHQQ